MEKIKKIVFLSFIVSLFIGCASIPKIEIGDPSLLIGSWRNAEERATEEKILWHFIDNDDFMVEIYEEDDLVPYRWSGMYMIKNGYLVIKKNGVDGYLFLKIHRLTLMEFQYYDVDQEIMTWVKIIDDREV